LIGVYALKRFIIYGQRAFSQFVPWLVRIAGKMEMQRNNIRIVIGIFGYGVYIFERESEPTRYTWLVGFYVRTLQLIILSIIQRVNMFQQLSFISLITGWPTDTYEDYLPNTFWGRACCMASTTVGLVLLSEGLIGFLLLLFFL